MKVPRSKSQLRRLMFTKGMPHEVHETCVGEICRMCPHPASHKVEEVTHDETRHPFTAYVCCGCFGLIMGIVAETWCMYHREENEDETE